MQKQNNNPATNRHLKLQIKTLQNTPRDADKLEQLLRLKEREKQDALRIKHTKASYRN
jgi:hypothetical protein